MTRSYPTTCSRRYEVARSAHGKGNEAYRRCGARLLVVLAQAEVIRNNKAGVGAFPPDCDPLNAGHRVSSKILLRNLLHRVGPRILKNILDDKYQLHDLIHLLPQKHRSRAVALFRNGFLDIAFVHKDTGDFSTLHLLLALLNYGPMASSSATLHFRQQSPPSQRPTMRM